MNEPIPFDQRCSVLQSWVQQLTFMQQSVLIAAVRGPDGIRKDHSIKVLCRWFRRCILLSAFERQTLTDPYSKNGGSFTGPSMPESELERICDGHSLQHCDEGCFPWWWKAMNKRSNEYLRYVDELPHHFQLHWMHAAEILGYKHPDYWIRRWWGLFYQDIVKDAHLFPETVEQMDKRLGDFEEHWREGEVVTAK